MLKLLQEEDGQTLTEYGVIITVIAILVLVVAALVGNDVFSLFTSVVGSL